MKYYIAQFVLVLTLLSNPMAGLVASVPDIFDSQDSAMEQMPCHTELSGSQAVDHGTDGDEACPMDCCDDDGCSMAQNCQNCLNPHFVNAILLETLDIYVSFAMQENLESAASYLSDRSTLPEIHPPDTACLS